VKSLFDDLETKRGVIDLLGRGGTRRGRADFHRIGKKLFLLSGSATIIAPMATAPVISRRSRRDRATRLTMPGVSRRWTTPRAS